MPEFEDFLHEFHVIDTGSMDFELTFQLRSEDGQELSLSLLTTFKSEAYNILLSIKEVILIMKSIKEAILIMNYYSL